MRKLIMSLASLPLFGVSSVIQAQVRDQAASPVVLPTVVVEGQRIHTSVMSYAPQTHYGQQGQYEGRDRDFDKTKPDQDKDGDNSECENGSNPTTGAPVTISTGNKVKTEVDFSADGQQPLYLTRHYSKSGTNKGIFGRRWSSNFDKRLGFRYGDADCVNSPGSAISCDSAGKTLENIYYYDERGARYTFSWNSSKSRWDDAKADSVQWLAWNSGNSRWMLTTESHGTLTFDSQGKLRSDKDQYGIGTTYDYQGSYEPDSVTSPRTLIA